MVLPLTVGASPVTSEDEAVDGDVSAEEELIELMMVLLVAAGLAILTVVLDGISLRGIFVDPESVLIAAFGRSGESS